MVFTAQVPHKMVTFEAKIIRANGTVEDLGMLAYWHRNPLRRALWKVKQFLRGRRAGTITVHQGA